MILSNLEIQKAIDEGRLIITPDPEPRSSALKDCPYDTTAVNLRLSKALSIPKKGPYVFDLRQGGIAPFLARNSDRLEIPEAGFVLEPNKFVLGNTQEKVHLPIEGGLAARIEGKSSFARCGLLVHFTAPTVHAGFNGTLTLEIINLGNVGIALWAGMPICQLILEAVDGTPEANPSQFQGQTTPAGTQQK
ncbi:MAG TPA: dCTP deaminase [Pyrinomonadaceae bacterium]|nr:dCTP deaminase [Pyrinomonadaceae bacterium]